MGCNQLLTSVVVEVYAETIVRVFVSVEANIRLERSCVHQNDPTTALDAHEPFRN